ncbi:glycosyltransferase family 2 protein [Pontibacillus sp. ALD_SL1]|uniref:glycosyltransferase family 2 protein n=1 Tax=Pontibacillus sp. ALD_SL1 TaxID=2777185 RepID=UPI001A95BDCF|nr:glycosyltransferase [Pontibacillus sp. ALD_SL1]QSS99696.1 glycosyltransferase family 2 protein [Pontibacillus sp. ALD_SL1]
MITADFLFYVALFLIWFVLVYHMFLMQGGVLFVLKQSRLEVEKGITDENCPTVSVLIPAHNEEVVIEDTLKAMVEIEYPRDKLEVILINDNSSDRTGVIADAYASQYPFLKVLHNSPYEAGKGKSGALNQGLKIAKGEFIVVYDADNRPEKDAVYNLASKLQQDPEAGAVIGKFRVMNAERNLLTRFINIETIGFQWLAQAGRWFWFKLVTIPGTNFAIRKSILETLGGWDEKALSEDTELSIRVYNLGYYIKFSPDAVTWEQEPETWDVWWKQRLRWARGNQYVIVKYMRQSFKLKRKKVFLDLCYLFFTYFIFMGSIVLSHVLFLLNLFKVIDISAGSVSIFLLLLAFVVFLLENLLALSLEEGQLTIRNAFNVTSMYFTYSQIWVLLVVFSMFLEIKRVLLHQEVKWYKTKRYGTDGHVPRLPK